MKRLLLFVVLSGVALSAAGQTPSSSVEVRGSLFQLPATPYKIWDLETYTGAYHLSNGERMFVRKAGQRMYAEIGNRPRKEIVATGAKDFVALDRQLQISFEDGDNGDIGGQLSMFMVVPNRLGDANGSDVVRLVAKR